MSLSSTALGGGGGGGGGGDVPTLPAARTRHRFRSKPLLR